MVATEEPILVGRPIDNTQVYILDSKLQLLPSGVIGELYVGGDGLARGYWKRSDLEAERFIPDPFSGRAGTRLYKTGDLARYRPDGNIECLGRSDNQVKIRGFRVELGEIESVLRSHPAIRDACVVVREDHPGDQRLVGYVTLMEKADAAFAAINSFLKERLPGYMIPTLVAMEEFPLTPNGKLDRLALPVPGDLKAAPQETPEPLDPIEQLLTAIWRDLLRVSQVGVHDNFFDLGGHSLLATQMVARLEKETGLRMKPKELAFQTLGQFATSCKERMQLR
jgi:acyl carrier protein